MYEIRYSETYKELLSNRCIYSVSFTLSKKWNELNANDATIMIKLKERKLAG